MEPYLLSLLTFFFGLFLGHRLTLWRDRRKEFNDIAQPIRDVLLKEIENPTPYSVGPSKIDADRLESVLHFWQRRAFRNCWLTYEKSKQESVYQDPVGQCFYKTTENVVASIDNVLRYTRRK
jgi:hypothetical protein